MTPLEGLPVLTAAEMRAAEQGAIAAGGSVDALMARAGQGVAQWAARMAGGQTVLILVGPGNNGGDGYRAARELRDAGITVRVAASAPPASPAATKARAAWGGPVEDIGSAAPAPIVVDALFGTGLSRPLDDGLAARLAGLVGAAGFSIAVDLPSGVAADDGSCHSPVPDFNLTLALGALKPAHLLQPGAAACGAIRCVPIGVMAASDARLLAPPVLPTPGAAAHKYSRGLVAVVSGALPGASRLAAEAALRAGAGYALLLGGEGGPAALVAKPWRAEALADPRIGAVVIGPGLGRDDRARARVATALAADAPLLIDGDALHLLSPVDLARRAAPTVVTPHAGEFTALFGALSGSKIERARTAAAQSQSVVVFKGADTVIAAPDGSVRLCPAASPWLSTAGAGDVLAGAIAAQLAAGLAPLAAACAGVWLHGRAAARLGRAFIADDLARALSSVR